MPQKTHRMTAGVLKARALVLQFRLNQHTDVNREFGI